MTKKLTSGQRMIASAKEALAFVEGESSKAVAHIPHEIDSAKIRTKISLI